MVTDYCSKPLTVGTVIMSGAAVSSSTNSLIVTRGAQILSSGSTFIPGELLKVSLSSTILDYLFETSGASFVSGSCTGQVRVANAPATLQIPSTGSSDISIWAGWCSVNYGIVNIGISFVLKAPVGIASSSPSFLPTLNPSILSTNKPTLNPSMKLAPTTSSPVVLFPYTNGIITKWLLHLNLL